MTILQDIADERNFGPVEERDWQRVDSFSPPTEAVTLPVEQPYEERRPQEIATARDDVEKAFISIQQNLDEDIY
jgi:hypothetical protein